MARPSEPAALENLYLHPGGLIVSVKPAKITTILSSCVSVCLWDRDTGLGGINHFVLARHLGISPWPARFGATAVVMLIEKMLAQGGRRGDLRAKVFGGACLVPGAPKEARQIGRDNIEVAEAVLASHSIPIVARDVGEQHARKLSFRTDDGSVWVKRLTA